MGHVGFLGGGIMAKPFAVSFAATLVDTFRLLPSCEGGNPSDLIGREREGGGASLSGSTNQIAGIPPLARGEEPKRVHESGGETNGEWRSHFTTSQKAYIVTTTQRGVGISTSVPNIHKFQTAVILSSAEIMYDKSISFSSFSENMKTEAIAHPKTNHYHCSFIMFTINMIYYLCYGS